MGKRNTAWPPVLFDAVSNDYGLGMERTALHVCLYRRRRRIEVNTVAHRLMSTGNIQALQGVLSALASSLVEMAERPRYKAALQLGDY